MVFPGSQMKIEDVRVAAVDTMMVSFYEEALRRFRDYTIRRLVHAMDGVDEEWEREARRLSSLGADQEVIGDLDADFSLTAIHVEQETRNILAVGLYHLFERQVTVFARGAVRLRGGDPKDIRGLKGARKGLVQIGLDCRDFACLGDIQVLRVVANTIKHGQEEARKEELEKLPREFFRDPALSDQTADEHGSLDFDLYVRRRHLDEWCAALLGFWEEMAALCWSQEPLTLGSLDRAETGPAPDA